MNFEEKKKFALDRFAESKGFNSWEGYKNCFPVTADRNFPAFVEEVIEGTLKIAEGFKK